MLSARVSLYEEIMFVLVVRKEEVFMSFFLLDTDFIRASHCSPLPSPRQFKSCGPVVSQL